MTLDFNQYHDHPRKTTELQSRAKNAPESLSIDDIARLIEEDCLIEGNTFHQDKQDNYDAIKAAVLDYIEANNGTGKPMRMNEEPPSKWNMYAHICLYTMNPMGAQVKNILPLIEVTKLADEFTVSPDDESDEILEVIWTVKNIWTED